ncbi:hypothetical protein [Clostridium sp. ZS2-4]|uniref:hypothetical protein n=1 Tax=Clostridium sp. ZS2-4 TaxID=2987703 RepID=UPI00227C97B7|nr:hypothetical protein [Clostridium sp. ZS2-4]MCY6353911.1 hypothetical protein [Clostridium sp. ZS2-4]
MFYFVHDIEENLINVNRFYEVSFLEEAIYNMSLENLKKEYENIKKWFMFGKMAKNFQNKGIAGEEFDFLLMDDDDVPYDDLDYTHDVLQRRIKQKMDKEFDDFEYNLKLRLSRVCSKLLFEVKMKNIMQELNN